MSFFTFLEVSSCRLLENFIFVCFYLFFKNNLSPQADFLLTQLKNCESEMCNIYTKEFTF